MASQGKINYANLFSITYNDSYKVIEYSPTLSTYNSGYHPDNSMKGQAIPPLVLYQRGTQPPNLSDVLNATRFFEIPIQKAALGWGGALPFFELLSVTEAISLIDLSYISSPCAQLLEECTPGIHMSSSNANWSSTASESEVVFTDSWGTGWAGPEKDIPFQISLDPGSLQRAEWIRFVAAFFNEEDKADQIFSEIQTDYNALRGMATTLSTDSGTEWGGRRPNVAWITKDWSGNMQFNNAHYKIDFVEDAGGQMVPLPATPPAGCTFGSNTDGAKTLSCPSSSSEALSSFKAFLAQADVIIDESWVTNHDPTAFNFTETYLVTAEEIPALARNPPNIFRLEGSVSDNVGAAGSVGSNWAEQMPSQPQQLLAGMMEALWSNNFDSPCGFKFLRRVFQGQGQTQLGDDDCPYHSADGNHNCAGIHTHMHEVPKCSQQATIEFTATPTASPTISPTAAATEQEAGDVSSAVGAKLSIAVVLAAMSRLWLSASGCSCTW
jgi:hypothetical protein